MQWWRDAVVYQVYVRSFADSDADGVGDLEGVRTRLGYLELLGVDAIWLTPFYPSPMADHGYDVSDPRDVDPAFGDLESFDDLVTDAHDHGIRVTIDLVTNHTSSEHEWFRGALGSAPGSPERARYHFHPGRGAHGAEPPNNWRSVFGGPAWTRAPNPAGTGEAEWYLHLFSAEQPDLNWTNPEVWADVEKTMRFWLDRGVDGFRIDVAHGMAKPAELPDSEQGAVGALLTDSGGDPRFDNDDVHEVHKLIRSVVDHYPGRLVIGEIWVGDDERFARYLRPDELHLGFNFRLAHVGFDAAAIRAAVEQSLAAVEDVPAVPTWTLSNHDMPRPATRYGGGAIGRKRARAMALVELALPGVVHLYNGEELGLPDAELPDTALREPVWERSGPVERGRDACRVPMPWEGGPPGYGFTDGSHPWLPMPREYGLLTVADQLEDTGSMLSLVRRAVELRKTHPGFQGDDTIGGLEWFGAPEGCLAFRRAGATLVCALNTSTQPVPLPPGEILLNSGPIYGDMLPPDTSAWLH